MPLPGGVATKTLTFGPYLDLTGAVAYVGMVGILSLSVQVEHLPSGIVIDSPVTFTIGSDGTAAVGPLVCNDDPSLFPQGTTYTVTWEALSYKPTPGNKTFQLLTAGSSVIDYDLIGTGYTPPSSLLAVVGSALVGSATVG